MNAALRNTLALIGTHVRPRTIEVDLCAIDRHCQGFSLAELHAFGELPIEQQSAIATRRPYNAAANRDREDWRDEMDMSPIDDRAGL